MFGQSPNSSDLEAAEAHADYFNGISSEYEPLNVNLIPETYSREIPTLTETEVGEKL